jgi:hypothetical protein
MDLRNTQLKDTYGNLVTTGTTAGSPTTGGLQNGQGTLLTSVGIGTDSPNALLELSGRSDTGDITMRFADKDGGVLTGQDHSNIEYFATDGSAVSAEVKTIYADVVGGLDYTISTRAGGGSLAERLRIRSTGDISFRDGSASEAFYWDASAGSLGIGTTSPNSPLTATKLLSGNSYLSPQSIRSSIENASVYGYFSSDSDDLTANKEQAGVLGIARVDSGTAPGSGNAVYGVLGVSSNAYGGGVNDFALGAIGDAYISGNVGIGTTSPSEKLQINSGYIKVVDNAYDEYFFSKERTDGSQLVGFQSHSAGALSIHSAGSEAMRILSSGKVGIGTDTVLGSATRLHVKVDDSNTDFSLGTPYHLLIENDNTTTNTGAMLGLRADTADGGIALHYGGSANVGYMTFHVDAGGGANSERMRIDSSGDVLVGKTTVSLGEVGVEVKPNGEVRCTTNGAQTLQLNRLTSDGTIVDFRKDSTVVGSIGTFTGYTTVGGNTNSGLIFRNGEILPWNNGSTAYANGTQDLGDAAARFKDLYLSGSVYLGGTTSANALDDYEEGTFTPVVAGTWTANPTSLVGKYTKIGNVVHVQVTFLGGTKATATSGYLEDLPFAASHGTGAVVDSEVIAQGSALFANTDRIWFTDNAFAVGTNRVTGTYLIN